MTGTFEVHVTYNAMQFHTISPGSVQPTGTFGPFDGERAMDCAVVLAARPDVLSAVVSEVGEPSSVS